MLSPNSVSVDGLNRTLRVLAPMAVDGVGPSNTCARLTSGMADAGGTLDVMFNRVRGETYNAPMRSLLRGPLAYLPYRKVSASTSKLLETWFLRRLENDDIAWLWPSVSLATHEEVARRGNPIILEGINSRMGQAKEILDAAYDAFGAPAGHGITQARIVEEDAKIALADTIFAPSRFVEQGLIGTPLEGRYLASSYGAKAPPSTVKRTRPQPSGDERVEYLFCGFACVRKGVHHLLDMWPRMPNNAVLKLIGNVEGVIATRYSDLLASDKVDVVGFCHDTDPHYANADVFVLPSLEEGDPLVTYEAALHGLPCVTSAIGGGRLADTHSAGLTLVEPADLDQFEAALMTLHRDGDRRIETGRQTAAAAAHYDWDLVGARRLKQLAERYS